MKTQNVTTTQLALLLKIAERQGVQKAKEAINIYVQQNYFSTNTKNS